MRILIDLTNSPHVTVFTPVIRALRADGHTVHVTARSFAQTVELAEQAALDAVVIGAHGGSTRAGKGYAAATRTLSLLAHTRRVQRSMDAPFDVAWSHGSTDLPVVCRILGIPHITMFDYEWAATMHRLNCRASWRVLVPDAIDPADLDRFGAAGKVVSFAGLKEEYYLAASDLDPAAVRASLGVTGDETLVVLRPPADMALYHRGITNDVFGAVLDRIATADGVRGVILPRTHRQHRQLADHYADALATRTLLMPEDALDGPSLVAGADLVVSAGGTMNREAAALGVPVYTVFAGRMGGVDAQLLADERLRHLRAAADVDLRPRSSRDVLVRDQRSARDLIGYAFDGLAA